MLVFFVNLYAYYQDCSQRKLRGTQHNELLLHQAITRGFRVDCLPHNSAGIGGTTSLRCSSSTLLTLKRSFFVRLALHLYDIVFVTALALVSPNAEWPPPSLLRPGLDANVREPAVDSW